MNCNTMYISSVTTTGTGVILVPSSEVKNLVNTTCYRLIIACNVEATANEPVFIQTALGNIPVICEFGNTVYANQLQKRTMYRVGYGDANDNYTSGQFVMHSSICPKSAVTTTQTTTTSKNK